MGDTQLVGRELKDAVIAGHDGNVWAKSQNFNVTPGEIQAILKNYDNQESLASSGFHLGGTKYFYLSGDDEVIRGKQGKCDTVLRLFLAEFMDDLYSATLSI